MGRYDEMEICELVRLYFLDKLSKILDKDDGALYRDDGLTTINNSNGPLMDKLKKKIIALFKEENFSITIDTNLEETDFLDVTFSLKTFCIYKTNQQSSIYQLQIQLLTTNNQRTS